MFDVLRNWLQGLVTSVPDDLAACEFDCHETDCQLGDWRNCERRLEMLRRREDEPST